MRALLSRAFLVLGYSYISSPQSIEISPVNGAMKIVNMALNSFKENDVGKAEVIAAIENLTNTNKCIL